MVKDNTMTLRREFTDLGKLQSPRTLTYSCVEQCTASREYCLRLLEHRADVLFCQEQHSIKADAETAKQVLVFLYENSVTPQVLHDILHDLRGQGLLAMEG